MTATPRAGHSGKDARTRVWCTAVALACALGQAACSDLVTGGLGEVEVYGAADERTSSGLAPAEGIVSAQLRVYLLSDESGQWAEVTEGVRDLTLDLRGTERRVGIKFLSSGRYSRFRAVFSRVQAVIVGGLVVGGTPINGEVNVDLGAQSSLTVEREILVELERDGALDVVMDLNAETWLAAVSPTARTVTSDAFSNALAVSAR
jgi:hypothetical protein